MADVRQTIKKVDLFPYRIKDRELFYDRDHPIIDPDNPSYKEYWLDKIKGYIEGRWIYDKGTYVWMPPKMDFFVNYGIVSYYAEQLDHPDLRAVEWIIFSYLLGIDGFSGFEGDEEYTCNDLISLLDKGVELDEVQMASIPKEAMYPDGSDYKKYIDPWEYLTRHYLLENKAAKPLGKPLYQNHRKNGFLMTARGTGKSSCIFTGDLGHEFLLGSVKSVDELSNSKHPLKFLAASEDAGQLARSINAFRLFYENMPGKYVKPDPLNEKEDISYGGPLYKNYQGQWKAEGGAKIQHVVKRKSGHIETLGSIMEFRPIGEGRYSVGAGDRFRRFYCEEAGLTDVVAFYRFIKDSMIVSNKKLGSFIGLGTSGDIKKVQPSAKMMFGPEGYGIFGIPNYWTNPDKKIGLFIPNPYKYREYYDENGNLKIDLAYERFYTEREKAMKEMDGVTYESEVMHNPGTPDEMLMPSDDSIMPKALAQRQRSDILNMDIFERFAVGEFEFDPFAKYGVRFKKDLTGGKRPIIDYIVDRSKIDKTGAPVVFEFPNEVYIPKNVYWVIYDPAAYSGQGDSFHSCIVYKWLDPSNPESMYDTIVCEWLGRYDQLEDNYEQVIKIAKYYNAQIFPEINTPGFVEYCLRNEYHEMLEGDAYALEQEIHGTKNIKRNYHKVGFRMNAQRVSWCDQKIPGYLKEVREKDQVTGAPKYRTIDSLYSLRMLDEIIHWNPKDNFDHISTLRGLMLLRGKIQSENLLAMNEDEDRKDEYKVPIHKPIERPKRASFLNY